MSGPNFRLVDRNQRGTDSIKAAIIKAVDGAINGIEPERPVKPKPRVKCCNIPSANNREAQLRIAITELIGLIRSLKDCKFNGVADALQAFYIHTFGQTPAFFDDSAIIPTLVSADAAKNLDIALEVIKRLVEIRELAKESLSEGSIQFERVLQQLFSLCAYVGINNSLCIERGRKRERTPSRERCGSKSPKRGCSRERRGSKSPKRRGSKSPKRGCSPERCGTSSCGTSKCNTGCNFVIPQIPIGGISTAGPLTNGFPNTLAGRRARASVPQSFPTQSFPTQPQSFPTQSLFSQPTTSSSIASIFSNMKTDETKAPIPANSTAVLPTTDKVESKSDAKPAPQPSKKKKLLKLFGNKSETS